MKKKWDAHKWKNSFGSVVKNKYALFFFGSLQLGKLQR